MPMLTFQELTDLAQVAEFDESTLAKHDPAMCPHRGEVFVGKGGAEDAVCNALGAAAGRSVACDETTCRMCIAHGEADAAANPYFCRQVLALAWTGSIAGPAADEPLTPDAETLDRAVSTIRAYAGDDIARRFVDALVYNQSVTPEKGVDLLESSGLSGGG